MGRCRVSDWLASCRMCRDCVVLEHCICSLRSYAIDLETIALPHGPSSGLWALPVDWLRPRSAQATHWQLSNLLFSHLPLKQHEKLVTAIQRGLDRCTDEFVKATLAGLRPIALH